MTKRKVLCNQPLMRFKRAVRLPLSGQFNRECFSVVGSETVRLARLGVKPGRLFRSRFLDRFELRVEAVSSTAAVDRPRPTEVAFRFRGVCGFVALCAAVPIPC